MRSKVVTKEGSGSLRWWLVVANLLFAGTPAVAAARGGGDAAGEIVGHCCVTMVGAMIRSAASPKKVKHTSARSRSSNVQPTQRGRCLVDEIGMECYALAVEIERSGDTLEMRNRALFFYNRACELRTSRRSCEHAERVAQEIAVIRDGREESMAFSVDAAESAFVEAGDRVVAGCENDTSARQVLVAVTFAETGEVTAVSLEPALPESLIAACVETVFSSIELPPFEGEDTTVRKTVSLLDVPSAYHLVDAR